MENEQNGVITRLIIVFAILGLFITGVYILRKGEEMKKDKCTGVDSSRTTLTVLNQYSDSVLTYLTLGADTNYVTDVNGIFGIKDSGLQGSFYMKKDSMYTYVFNGKGISGNISFGTAPLNCPDGTWKTGVNLYEFTLNVDTLIADNQETFDISNVAGVNAIGNIYTIGGGAWIAGGTTVSVISNSYIYDNSGNYGVFPFGCDVCTASQNPPKCADTLKIATPQTKPICNVSRNAKASGGSVNITFVSWAK